MQKRNTKIPMTVGPKFKVIRKRNHVSLKSLAQKVGITSTSALSRWERGETGLPVEIFERLLTTMNISYNEIIIAEIEIKQVIAKVEFAYQENDVEKLKNLSFQLLEKYHHENDEYLKKEALIKSAIALNFYFDLSGQDLSDDEYKKALAEQFVGY